MTYEITFWGQIPSKKNEYLPKIINGKARFIKKGSLRNELDVLSSQIPAEMRGLMLEHPAINIQITVAHQAADRDSMQTTILDLLVAYKVLYNDNIKRCNGMMTVPPAIVSDHWKTVVTLTSTGSSSASRSRRRASQPSLPL